jgi:hypothetical protein
LQNFEKVQFPVIIVIIYNLRNCAIGFFTAS